MFFEILNVDLGPGLEKIRDSSPISYKEIGSESRIFLEVLNLDLGHVSHPSMSSLD